MNARRASHDVRLLDALTAFSAGHFKGYLWRVVHGNRSPIDGSKGAGRWNVRESEVLYCALEEDGALSEIHFHISRGQSVFPSRLRSWVYKLEVSFERVLDLSDTSVLARLGIDLSRYHELLYSETQKIGEATGFLGYETLIVPNARHSSNNLVVFPANTDLDALYEVSKTRVKWEAWRQKNRQKSQARE